VLLKVDRDEAQVPQRTDRQGQAKPILFQMALAGFVEIGGCQGEVGRQLFPSDLHRERLHPCALGHRKEKARTHDAASLACILGPSPVFANGLGDGSGSHKSAITDV